MARMGVWSVGTVAITGDEGESGTAVLVVDEDEGGLVANDLWASMGEGEAVATSLKQLFGEIGRPRKLVVKTGTLAKAVRAAGVREEITVGATPKLDALMEELEKDAAALANMPGPLDGEGTTSDHLRAFFASAQVMRHVAPWGFFPPATSFSVEAAALGIEEGGVFVLSSDDDEDDELEDEPVGIENDDLRPGEAPGGWMFVESPEDFEALSEAMTEGSAPRDKASVIALAYERAEDLGPAFEAFAREHELDLPADGWIPVLSRSKRGVGTVAVSASDYELATAICTAIANITVALAEDDEEEVDGVRAELVTASGMQIFVEGPMADDDEEDQGESE
ncbi:hypothetical protein [Sandaracinus amylolyticus]|uniref:hypothetical protein n=1 Tax=Sandaracinus amylolyticus TaxID=927083 RepID=UPI001F2EE4A7|nr:hypothetical protein [Sandaracinus amylolyticus]UJR86323.1 Hypothetical protein I5071_84070 [Sandaracinus amylolyticus]